ncbi:hypothetical protein ES702_05935 [subsurface metagenome]
MLLFPEHPCSPVKSSHCPIGSLTCATKPLANVALLCDRKEDAGSASFDSVEVITREISLKRKGKREGQQAYPETASIITFRIRIWDVKTLVPVEVHRDSAITSHVRRITEGYRSINGKNRNNCA